MTKNLLLLIACIAIGLGWTFYQDRQLPPNPALDAAPTFETKNFNGKKISLNDYKGKVTLIHFWATWCPPCIVEMPALVELAKSEKDLIVLAIAVKDQKKDIDRFLAKTKITMPDNFIIALDPDKNISENLYETKKLPESYLLTPEHTIARKIIGAEDNWNNQRWKKRIRTLKNAE